MSYNRLFEKVSLFYRLAQYGDRTAYLKAVGQASLSGPPMPTPGSPGTPGARPLSMREFFQGHPDQSAPSIPTVNVEDLPKAPTPAAVKAPTVTTETQDQLNQLLAIPGKMALIKVDGILGPETQRALKLFQTTHNLPATPANVKSVYLKEHNPGLETKTPF